MSTQTKFPKTRILGVEVDSLTLSQAIDHILQLVQHRQAHYIVKPYVEHLELAYRDRAYRRVLNQAYLSLPDGVSLNWASYFYAQTGRHWWNLPTSLAKIVTQRLELHLSLPNYSWGTNFTWSLLQAAAQQQLRVFLVGSPQGSQITHTQQYLQRRIRGLQIVGTQTGRDPATNDFSPALEHQLLRRLRKLEPDIVLVAIGLPHQETVIARLQPQLNHGVLIGEGGTFDYRNFGGKLPKAPLAMQRRGLEWLWRLIRQPWRLRRQLAIPRFIWRVYRSPRAK